MHAETVQFCRMSLTAGFFIHSPDTVNFHTSFLQPVGVTAGQKKPQAGRGAAAASALMACGHAASACRSFTVTAGGVLWGQTTS